MNQTNKDLLIEMMDCDILMKDDVLESIYSMKMKKVLSVHTNKVTETKKGDRRWQTYIGHGKDRKKISAVSKEKLYEKLYDYYYVLNQSKVTIRTLLPEWQQKRLEANLSDRTHQRYKDHWKKYYEHDKIVDMPLNKVKADHVETFFHKCIKDYGLTKKGLDNMKFLLIDILKMAVRQEVIKSSPYDVSDIKTYGCKPPKKKSDKSRVYGPKEKLKLFGALNQDLIDHPKVTDAYAVFLLFKIGVRIGEVVAIKEEDLDFEEGEIHIYRMQTLKKDKDGVLRPIVVEYPKTSNSDRFLPLGDYEIDLFKKVLAINEHFNYDDQGYIFVDEKGRTKARAIDNRIRKCCEAAGIEVKSAHDIRRTVASELHIQGVPLEIIKDFCGHEEESSTWGYIYDNISKAKRSSMIKESLRSMDGLKRTQNI